MVQWEYLITALSDKMIAQELANFGKAGWELVCLNSITEHTEKVMAVFKRPL